MDKQTVRQTDRQTDLKTDRCRCPKRSSCCTAACVPLCAVVGFVHASDPLVSSGVGALGAARMAGTSAKTCSRLP